MNRARLLEEIAELDRQINRAVDKTKLPDLNLKHRSFPLPGYIGAAVLIGGWAFAKKFLEGYHRNLDELFLVLGALTLLFSIWNTFLWLVKGRQKVDRSYVESTKEVDAMQAKRKELQKRLAEIEKAGG